jgi:Uma2 family endonuclease
MSAATLPDADASPSVVYLPRQDFVVAIPASVRSLQGFRDWYATDTFPEEGRISYLAGEIVIDMSHERLSSHVDLKGEIFHRLKLLLEELGTGQFFTDGVRVVNESADVSNEPDGCYIAWESANSGKVQLNRDAGGRDATEVVGTPDMVLEVVSRSSVGKDKIKLRDLYHRAGIPEFWLVDARRDDVTFDILVLSTEGYVPSPTVDDWHESPVFGRRFRIERFVNPLGLWQYRLLVQKPE